MADTRVLLSWSSGKDSAWALHILRQAGTNVVGLLTTFNEAFGRAAMHGVRRDLIQAQADAAGLPLNAVDLPWPCSNDEYERRMKRAIAAARESGVTHIAFGDLFLEDIRAYRIKMLEGSGVETLFPIWTSIRETPRLARQMIAAGLRATLTCVDPKQLDAKFAGREFDASLLEDLPPGVDPCGERGEFHTFCHAGPIFTRPVLVERGEVVERDGFWFADLRRSPNSPSHSL